MPPRVHLHRVVPSVPSRWSSRPVHPGEILPGQQGRTPSRPARRLRLRGRLTRATTDSHRAAPPARAASIASTPHQPLAAPQSRLAIRPLAAKRSPATISISIASRVEAARSRKRRACLLSWGQITRGTCISLVPDSPARRRDSAPHCRGRVGCKSNLGKGLGEGATGRRWGFSRPRS
jgi:hypothetical protein